MLSSVYSNSIVFTQYNSNNIGYIDLTNNMLCTHFSLYIG